MRMSGSARAAFSRAQTEGHSQCAALGVSLRFATLHELLDVNKANAASWRPLLPIFSPHCNDIRPGTYICWLGYNENNEVVVTQAARLFDWKDTNFHEEAESLRLFYQEPDRWRGKDESIEVTAPSARKITGRVVYTGAHWVRPDYRGKGLTAITPRMVKALAMTIWRVDFFTTIMAKDIFDRGVADRAGYWRSQWSVDLNNTPTGTFPAALLWDYPEDFTVNVMEGRR